MYVCVSRYLYNYCFIPFCMVNDNVEYRSNITCSDSWWKNKFKHDHVLYIIFDDLFGMDGFCPSSARRASSLVTCYLTTKHPTVYLSLLTTVLPAIRTYDPFCRATVFESYVQKQYQYSNCVQLDLIQKQQCCCMRNGNRNREYTIRSCVPFDVCCGYIIAA